MAAEVPIHFNELGRRRVPTIDFAMRVDGQHARLDEAALVDTGSALTIMSRDLLRITRFDLSRAKPFRPGISGIGGLTDAWFLEDAVISVRDRENVIHRANMGRIFFTRSRFPPIFGRQALAALNGVLHIDFLRERGHLEVG